MEKRIVGVWPWFAQRLTAAFLVVGMVIHFIVLHYTIERPITFEKVILRLSSPGWVIFDILLLGAVIYHALNGVWSIMTDWNMGKKARKIWGWLLSIIGIASFFIGIYILIPFSK
ncbi:succinate dehydrogenase, hydrophobic membrane anchor protein [candidate division KSB1 bacterium]|nr:MAG: succinate dehydrogenase, hydrophobic membrane anchor protein [candidate division KSB1 bacterium]